MISLPTRHFRFPDTCLHIMNSIQRNLNRGEISKFLNISGSTLTLTAAEITQSGAQCYGVFTPENTLLQDHLVFDMATGSNASATSANKRIGLIPGTKILEAMLQSGALLLTVRHELSAALVRQANVVFGEIAELGEFTVRVQCELEANSWKVTARFCQGNKVTSMASARYILIPKSSMGEA